jgi:uracil-DNA glycosylase
MNVAQRQAALDRHVASLRRCRRCPKMLKPVVSGGPVLSRVMLVGQAPGDKEPVLGRPFAWTAGKKLFRWFNEHAGIDEATFRSRVYMAAVCRCFPGKRPIGGDRVPDNDEILNCSFWMKAEFELLEPRLVIAVGKLAILQFMPCDRLDTVITVALPGTGPHIAAPRAEIDRRPPRLARKRPARQTPVVAVDLRATGA